MGDRIIPETLEVDVHERCPGSCPHCFPSFWASRGSSEKGRNHYKGKSKVGQCSHTLNWPVFCADEIETVSQRPSMVMVSLKRMSSSAVEGHCRFPRKEEKNQASP